MKNTRYRLFVVLATLGLLQGIFPLALFSQEEPEELLVVATDYPPYEFAEPDGELRGFDVEVVEEAFQRVGLSVTFEFYPWARAVQMAREGAATAALSCSRGPERDGFIEFSEPISYMTDIMMVRKEYDGPPLQTLTDADAQNLDIGVIRGEVIAGFLDESGIPYDESPNFEVALKKLADGRIDAVPLVLEYTLYNIEKLNIPNEFKWFPRTDSRTTAFHLCFSKQWPDVKTLVEQFNRGLKAIQDDGTYDEIHAKYQ